MAKSVSIGTTPPALFIRAERGVAGGGRGGEMGRQFPSPNMENGAAASEAGQIARILPVF